MSSCIVCSQAVLLLAPLAWNVKEAVIEASGHFVAEQCPRALLDELRAVFAQREGP